ncbi:MAG: hypothetical protein INR66_23720 [Gordonia polyisoprenivorans]|nr:hypothetical protein [Gordonia polyisoprenivorans]
MEREPYCGATTLWAESPEIAVPGRDESVLLATKPRIESTWRSGIIWSARRASRATRNGESSGR